MIFYLPPNIPLLEIELVTRPGRCPQIVAACVSVVAVVLFVAIFVVCRSWRRERVKKKQAIANAHAVTQWTKKLSSVSTIFIQQSDQVFFSTFYQGAVWL